VLVFVYFLFLPTHPHTFFFNLSHGGEKKHLALANDVQIKNSFFLLTTRIGKISAITARCEIESTFIFFKPLNSSNLLWQFRVSIVFEGQLKF